MIKEANVTPELLNDLNARVAEKTLNPDKIFFTSEPLESCIEPQENATKEEIEQVEKLSKTIHEANEKLCREAKSLKTLLTEAKILEAP